MAKLQHDSFERFYYEKIGLGEGCGCAEHVIRIRDLDTIGERMASGQYQPGIMAVTFIWLRNCARKLSSRRAPGPRI